MPASADGHTRLRALRWLCLAIAPAADTAALDAVWPREGQWQQVVALADAGFVLPAMARAIDRHALRGRLPDDLVQFLDAIFALNAERRAALRRQMIALNQRLAGAGIVPVWMKGAETLIAADWASRDRVMRDLDLWIVDTEARRAALDLLDGDGWLTFAADEGKRGWDLSHHDRPLHHPDWPAPIEIHRSPVIRQQALVLPSRATADAVLWSRWEGGPFGQLDPVSGALLSLVQATAMAHADFALGRVPLMKSLDFAERIERDFGGMLPAAMRTRLALPSIRRLAPRMLTFVAEFYGMPLPVQSDRSYVRAVERDLLQPRLNAAIGASKDFLGRRAVGLLQEPGRLPGLLRDLLRPPSKA